MFSSSDSEDEKKFEHALLQVKEEQLSAKTQMSSAGN
jgi:hypothetical protein